jgi:hypothetical protein
MTLSEFRARFVDPRVPVVLENMPWTRRLETLRPSLALPALVPRLRRHGLEPIADAFEKERRGCASRLRRALASGLGPADAFDAARRACSAERHSHFIILDDMRFSDPLRPERAALKAWLEVRWAELRPSTLFPDGVEGDAFWKCYQEVPELVHDMFARRYFLLGPRLGGSSWHVDQLNSSFYNQVVWAPRGGKLWTLHPPGPPPAPLNMTQLHDASFGLHDVQRGAGADLSGEPLPGGPFPTSNYDVFQRFAPARLDYLRAPLYGLGSKPFPLQWRLDSLAAAEARSKASGTLECLVEEGETLYVPPMWWHHVVNVGDNLALTENLIEPTNREEGLGVLRDLLELETALERADLERAAKGGSTPEVCRAATEPGAREACAPLRFRDALPRSKTDFALLAACLRAVDP